MGNGFDLIRRYGPLVGRNLLALIFVISGFGKITGFVGTASYMAAKGIPLTEIALVITIIIELGGGFLLILGWQTRWAALALFLFVIPTTLIFHNFWAVEMAQVRMQQIQFLKNLCIMGGLLYVMAFGAGSLSVDNRSKT
jgi:putative oxidoreductase